MEITDEHRKCARRQFGAVLDPDDDDRLTPSPARVGYLAAVERIEAKKPRAEAAGATSVATVDHSRIGLSLDAWTDGTVTVNDGWGEVQPAEVRELAYELLVLADLAEGER